MGSVQSLPSLPSTPRNHIEEQNVVLSVKYDVRRNVSKYSSFVEALLGSDICYSPNHWSKGDCRYILGSRKPSGSPTEFPYCLGKKPHCSRFYEGSAPSAEQARYTCWRASFRWHLERIRNGQEAVMLQIVEDGELGHGQEVETEIAKDLNIRVVRVDVPVAPWACTKFQSLALLLACLCVSMSVKFFLQGVEFTEDTFLVVLILSSSVSTSCLLAGGALLILRRSMARCLWYVPDLLVVLAAAGDRVRASIESPECDAAVTLRSKYVHLDYLVYIDIALLFVLALWGERGVIDARAQEHIMRDLFRQGILVRDVAGTPEDRPRLYRFWLDSAFLFHVLFAYLSSVRCCILLGFLVVRSADADCFSCESVVAGGDALRLLFARRWGPCLTIDLAVWLSGVVVGLLPVKVGLWLIRPLFKHLDIHGQGLFEIAVTSGNITPKHRRFTAAYTPPSLPE